MDLYYNVRMTTKDSESRGLFDRSSVMKTFSRLAFIAIIVGIMTAGAVLAATTTFTGYIASGAQSDTYRLAYRAGQAVVADLFCDEPKTLDPVLSLYNNAGQLIAFNDDGGIKACDAFRSSRIVFAFAESGTYTWKVDGFGSSTGAYTLRIVDGVDGFAPSDDRINPHAFAPVAVYCRDEGAVEVWNIDAEGQGTPLFSVSGADVGAGVNGSALGGAGAVTLSKLGDGRLQVNAPMLDGKGYVFIFDGCPATASETYTVEGGTAVLFETRQHD
jgi:hypothetical protein